MVTKNIETHKDVTYLFGCGCVSSSVLVFTGDKGNVLGRYCSKCYVGEANAIKSNKDKKVSSVSFKCTECGEYVIKYNSIGFLYCNKCKNKKYNERYGNNHKCYRDHDEKPTTYTVKCPKCEKLWEHTTYTKYDTGLPRVYCNACNYIRYETPYDFRDNEYCPALDRSNKF